MFVEPRECLAIAEAPEAMRVLDDEGGLSQAEKAYAIGLICYAGGDLVGAERYFSKALKLNPRMDKADHALKQVRNERGFGNQ